MHKLAIIADPHYHEVFAGYRFSGVTFNGRQGAAIRTRADTAASTRIFNESRLALLAALDTCVAEGIRTILIAGDLSDDGQVASMDAALALLARYESEHGIRFFLTPGNHDVYGMSGRHHTKAFYNGDVDTTAITSDPNAGQGSVFDPTMFCRSYTDIATLWAPFGIQRRNADLYWECPFGTGDDFANRMFDMTSPDGSVTHRQLDLSYLVEPEPGLWLVSVDANVFEPRNGHSDNTRPDAFLDSTDAGWNALVRLKPFILDWLASVSHRAREQGKTLVCFSHYPVLDTYDDTLENEQRLFGATQAVRRTPSAETAFAVAKTGIGMHFSGHLHVSDTNTVSVGGNALTNVAIPSPVAFPPAFAVLNSGEGRYQIDYRLLNPAGFDAFFPFYSREDLDGHWPRAQSYGDFLYRHVRELVVTRYLPREWPADLANALQSLSVSALIDIAKSRGPIDPRSVRAQADDGGPTGIDLVTDWYAARKASALVFHYVSEARMMLYRQLIDAYAMGAWSDPNCLQARIKLFLEMMARYLDEECLVRGAAV
ncbi:MAG: metallophosphoesterase [Pelagibacterium sp.]|uniref:metallophosphoesterase family protein n=1 Tax=Pelagibacterium sp. TaxID=1967288 RepID=UPI0032EBAF82